MTEKYNYVITITTGKQSHSITSSWNPFIELYDKNGNSTNKILIGLDSKMNGVGVGNKLQPNCVQELGFSTFESNTDSMCHFQTSTKIDKLEKINIGFNSLVNKIDDLIGVNINWNISRIKLECLTLFKTYIFKPKQPIKNNLIINISQCEIIENSIEFKPVIQFRSCDNNFWSISILLILETNTKYPPYMLFENENNKIISNKVVILKHCFSKTLIRYDVQLPMESNPITWKYSYLKFDHSNSDESFLVVPKINSNPCIFFASCIGVCPSFCRSNGIDDAFVGFEYALKNHQQNSYHLAIYGGDQIYADNLITACPTLRKWTYLNEKERIKFIPTEEMIIELDIFYFNLYFYTWGQKFINKFLSSVSSIMMWDDHDIINGYGSRKNYPVLDAIYLIARQNFILFQLGGHCNPGLYCHNPEITIKMTEKNRYESLSYYRKICDIGILVLDTRSQRNTNTVIQNENYIELQNKFLGKEEIFKNSPFYSCKHLYVVIGVPLIFFPYICNISQKVLKYVPGEQEIESDIKDQWTNHLEERNKLIEILINFSILNNIKVTLLTGDSHIGAFGSITVEHENKITVIEQPISSGIGSQAPSKLILDAYKITAEKILHTPIKNYSQFNESMKKLIIDERNFLTLQNDKITFTTFKNNINLNNLEDSSTITF